MKNRLYKLNIISVTHIYNVEKDRFKTKIVYYDPINDLYRVANGYAKCNPNDTFDSVKGTRISEDRAMIKVCDKMTQVLKRYLKTMNSKLSNVKTKTNVHLLNLVND